MPVAALKSIVRKSGKSMSDIKRYWDEAKKQAHKEGFKESDDRFWAYVMAITMKRAGLEVGDLDEEVEEAFDQNAEMQKIIDFIGNERKVMLVWEKAKEQAEILYKTGRISEEDATKYAFDILKLGVGYKLTESKSIADVENTPKVGEVITKAEWEELEKLGYSKKKLSPKQIKTVEKEVAVAKKKHGKNFTMSSAIGSIVLGFVGGIVVAKAIDTFFTSLRDLGGK